MAAVANKRRQSGHRPALRIPGYDRGHSQPTDLDARDPDYIRERLPRLWITSSLWYRGEVRGLANMPDSGPALLVGNYSGGNVAPDTVVFTQAFSTYFGVERPFYQLVPGLRHPIPGFGSRRKFGTAQATPENARLALERGAAVLVYPGGDHESHRPSWRGNSVDLGRGTEYIEPALEQHVPIVPVVSIGAQETALFLTRGERLTKLLALDRLLGLESLPISMSLPWGVNLGDRFGHIPLPAKITIEVLPPLDVRAKRGRAPDAAEVNERLSAIMQETLNALAAERRVPVLG